MGKTREISEGIRIDIIIKYNSGISVPEISKFYNLSRQTVYYQINKYKKNKSIKNRARSGRPRKTNELCDRIILRQFKKNSLKTPRSVSNDLFLDYGIEISDRTIRRRLQEANYGTYIARNIPHISQRNRIKRLDFAKKYVHMPHDYWKRVLWTDESTFQYHSSKKRVYVRIPKSLRKIKAPVVEGISHGGGSIMFWGCIAYNGLGDLVPVDRTMDKDTYLEVLNENALSCGERLIGESFIFQQDNAPCHKAKIITNFLKEKGVFTLEWPPQSPDLNIIENVWAYIKRNRDSSLQRTRQDTVIEIKALWNDIPIDFIQALVNSVQRRLQKVIKARGGYIFY